MIETFFSDKIFSWIFSKSDLLCLKRPNLAFVMGFLPSARWGIVQKSDTVKSKILEKNSKKHIFRKKYMIETFFSDKIFSWDFSKSDLLCLKRTNLAFIMWFSHLTSPNLNLRVCVGGHMKLPFWTASDVISESLQAFCQFFFLYETLFLLHIIIFRMSAAVRRLGFLCLCNKGRLCRYGRNYRAAYNHILQRDPASEEYN